MSEIFLSILMPTLPSRRATFEPLFDKLAAQVKDKYFVEVIALLDNRRMTIGEKCNALMGSARGRFLTFVDDDDDVSPNYIDSIWNAMSMTAWDADVITFGVACELRWRDGRVQSSTVFPDVNDPNDDFRDGAITKRKPMQIAVWRTELARTSRWAHAQQEADVAWASKLWPQVKAQHKITDVLYTYKFSEAGTEAK